MKKLLKIGDVFISPGISSEDYEKIIVSVMEQFNFTREEAIEEINKN